MFPTSYFAREYYAPRYFPRNGDITEFTPPICITSITLVPSINITSTGISNTTSITNVEIETC